MASELFVSRVGFQTWAVLTERGRLAEVQIEHRDSRGRVGDILKARVRKIVPSIQAVFVDIGEDRDALLAAPDLVLPDERKRSGASSDRPLAERVARDREVVVQIERESSGSKGARVTGFVNLPGRNLVHHPFSEERTVARRIVDASERERLLGVVRELSQTGGFVVRTMGKGVSESALRDEAVRLHGSWSEIEKRAKSATAPAVLHRDLDLPRRALRELDWTDLEGVRVDDAAIHESMVDYARELDPTKGLRILHHGAPEPLFRTAGIDRPLRRALRPRVWLRSGAYLVIERTEALIGIDVNTGKSGGRRSAAETAVRINLEAAEEVARQIRLRDLGGTIVIDFIDMADPEDRARVCDLLGKALRADRARTRIVSMSDEGVIQIARRRSRGGLDGALTSSCPTCSGRGWVRSPETVAGHAILEMRLLLPVPIGEEVTVRAHPDVADQLERVRRAGVEPGLDGGVRIIADDTLHPEHFQVVGPPTRS